MNKRKTALDIIRYEYATFGEETTRSMRAYCENRVGFDARKVAISAGLKIYNAKPRLL